MQKEHRFRVLLLHHYSRIDEATSVLGNPLKGYGDGEGDALKAEKCSIIERTSG